MLLVGRQRSVTLEAVGTGRSNFMKRFYLITDKCKMKGAVEMDHDSCGRLMSYAPAHRLTKDLEAWRDGAMTGDVFEIDYDRHILCWDLDRVLEFLCAGATRL